VPNCTNAAKCYYCGILSSPFECGWWLIVDGTEDGNPKFVYSNQLKIFGDFFYVYSPDDDYEFQEPIKHLQQYTGLKDKNGKEIYESDILDFGMVRCVVKYNPPSFAAYNSENHEWNIQYAGCEVIGNIYENPELLK
jgi:hypothetical protein